MVMIERGELGYRFCILTPACLCMKLVHVSEVLVGFNYYLLIINITSHDQYIADNTNLILFVT